MISIITALHGRIDLTRQFWKSLAQNQPQCDWEIVWVDDGSSDGTREWLRRLDSAHCRFVFNDKNLGYAASNNIGVRAACGDVLFFLNNDLLLQKDWFAPLAEVISSTQDIGIAGNVQLNVTTGRIDHAGICYDLIGRADHYLKGRALSTLRGQGRFSHAVTSACCAIRRDLFLSSGGFDEAFRNGCEDVDLCLRLGQMGYRHWVDYRSVVYHHVSASPGRKDYEMQNQALFLKRWGHLTSKWGQEDWPQNYLSRYSHCPWKLNGTKTVDALLRLAGLKHGDSKWVAKKREEILTCVSLAQSKETG